MRTRRSVIVSFGDVPSSVMRSIPRFVRRLRRLGARQAPRFPPPSTRSPSARPNARRGATDLGTASWFALSARVPSPLLLLLPRASFSLSDSERFPNLLRSSRAGVAGAQAGASSSRSRLDLSFVFRGFEDRVDLETRCFGATRRRRRRGRASLRLDEERAQGWRTLRAARKDGPRRRTRTSRRGWK